MSQTILRFDVATRVRPCAGEVVSGDLVSWKQVGDSTFVLTLDATGHGREAHRVAEVAERTFGAANLTDPAEFLLLLDEALRGSRGAAAAVARLDGAERSLSYAAVGNISGRLVGRADYHLVCRDGTLGQRFRSPKLQTCELRPQDLLVMHSDGISARFSTETFADLHTGQAQSVAAQLLERFGKMHDDASCAVVRVKE